MKVHKINNITFMEQENKNEEQEAMQKEKNELSQKQVQLDVEKNDASKTILITILITTIVVGSAAFLIYKYNESAKKEKTVLEKRIANLEKTNTAVNNKKPSSAVAQNNKPSTITSNDSSNTVQNNRVSNPVNDVNTVPGESGESEHAAPDNNDDDMMPAAAHNPHDAMNQNIGDSAGLYTVDLPADWIIVENEGAMGMQVSRVISESPDFAYHTDPNFAGPFEPSYYDEGAMISIHLTQAQGPNAEEPIGVITQSTQTVVDGVMGEYYVYTEPSTFEGEILGVVFRKDGVEYTFRFVYNPTTYPQGPDVFAQILDSVKLN